MKTKLLLLMLIMGALSVNGQNNFGKSIISDNLTGGVYGILEKDLDDDGDMDLMSASKTDNTLAYYLNDGAGNFTQNLITTNFDGAAFIDAGDFDNDGDIDFVASGTSDLSWFENDNGTFVEHSIATGLSDPIQVRVYDIGSLMDPATPDGDLDVGILISGENTATIYMNDGSNNFSRFNVISISSPKFLNGGDFNADGVDDLLLSSYNSNEVHWYKLDTWGFVDAGAIATNFGGAFGVEGGDIDLDGDDDVIATAYTGNEVAWFENDGSAAFTKHSIDANLPGASFLRWTDIDDDGDKDIIVSAFGTESGGATTGHQVVIYFNDGAQNFTKTVVDDAEQGPATFCFADFNGDGLTDVVYAASVSNKIVMLAQGVSGGVEHVGATDFHIYPNPAASVIYIDSDKEIDHVDLFDITGRKVLTTENREIPVVHFNSGYYLLNLYLTSGQVYTQKIWVK